MSNTYRKVPIRIEQDLINNGKDNTRKIKSFDRKHQAVTVYDGKAVHDIGLTNNKSKMKNKNIRLNEDLE